MAVMHKNLHLWAERVKLLIFLAPGFQSNTLPRTCNLRTCRPQRKSQAKIVVHNQLKYRIFCRNILLIILMIKCETKLLRPIMPGILQNTILYAIVKLLQTSHTLYIINTTSFCSSYGSHCPSLQNIMLFTPNFPHVQSYLNSCSEEGTKITIARKCLRKFFGVRRKQSITDKIAFYYF